MNPRTVFPDNVPDLETPWPVGVMWDYAAIYDEATGEVLARFGPDGEVLPVPEAMTKEDLKRRRQALGLSQRQLAEALGVSASTVAHWEQGVQAIPAYLDLALRTLERSTACRGHRA